MENWIFKVDRGLGVMYRYDEIHYAPPLDEYETPVGKSTMAIRLREYPIIKNTPCGHVIDVYGTPKFINLSWTKQWACKTKEQARESYRQRKKSQIRILSARLRDAELGLKAIEDPSTVDQTEIRTDNVTFAFALPR